MKTKWAIKIRRAKSGVTNVVPPTELAARVPSFYPDDDKRKIQSSLKWNTLAKFSRLVHLRCSGKFRCFLMVLCWLWQLSKQTKLLMHEPANLCIIEFFVEPRSILSHSPLNVIAWLSVVICALVRNLAPYYKDCGDKFPPHLSLWWPLESWTTDNEVYNRAGLICILLENRAWTTFQVLQETFIYPCTFSFKSVSKSGWAPPKTKQKKNHNKRWVSHLCTLSDGSIIGNIISPWNLSTWDVLVTWILAFDFWVLAGIYL